MLPVSSYLTRQVHSCNNIYQRSSYEQQGPKSWSFIQRLHMVCTLGTFPHPSAQTSSWLLQLPVMVALDNLGQYWQAKAKSLSDVVYLANLYLCACYLLFIPELEPAGRSKSQDNAQHGCCGGNCPFPTLWQGSFPSIPMMLQGWHCKDILFLHHFHFFSFPYSSPRRMVNF